MAIRNIAATGATNKALLELLKNSHPELLTSASIVAEVVCQGAKK
jgi:hypothetical protein